MTASKVKPDPLWDRFQQRFDTPSSSEEIVQFLQDKAGLDQKSAEYAFERLRDAGVAGPSESEGPSGNRQSSATQRQWTIAGDALSKTALSATLAHARGVHEDLEEAAAVDLLLRAIELRATDIHLDPKEESTKVRLRIDGQLHPLCELSPEVAGRLMTQLKVMSDLDIAQPFNAQEGRLKLPEALQEHDVRITTTPVVGGESVSLRILHRDQLVRPLGTLGFSEPAMQRVKQLLNHGEGLVLVTGPTGSGKTTTLYSLLDALDDGRQNIMTIEDPPEVTMANYQQVEVDPAHEVSMFEGLRTILRMDPDIIMLGEIRDAETASAAMRAASSGKYIFSTFHTRDVASVVTALADIGVDARSLAGNLRSIISQRLIRRLCRFCRGQRELSPREHELFTAQQMEPPTQVATPNGCPRCRNTGYFGRVGIFEVLANEPEIEKAISEKVPEQQLRQLLREKEIDSLAHDALRKVADGTTSLEEASEVAWVDYEDESGDR